MLNKLYGYLAAIAGVLLAIAAIFRSGKSSGKDEVKAEQNEQTIEAIREAKQREEDTASMSDDELINSMRKQTSKNR